MQEEYELTSRSHADELRTLVNEGLASGVSTSDAAEFLQRLQSKYDTRLTPSDA